MDVFINGESQVDDLVYASVNYGDSEFDGILVKIVSMENSNRENFKIRLATTTPVPRHYTVYMEDCEEFNINVGESDEEHWIYMNRQSDKRALTGVYKGSKSDALAVYESMVNDVDVCSRVKLAKDCLQTRSGCYHRLCRNGEMTCKCLVEDQECSTGGPTPPPSPTTRIVNDILNKDLTGAAVALRQYGQTR